MKQQTVELPSGLEINLASTGETDLPPLLLLHGYPSSHQLWRKCVPGLAERFCIYAPDLPGHGGSSKPLDADYDRDFWVRFLHELVDHLAFEQIDLVAHDLGAMAALGFVSRYPERIKRFVVMDTAPYADWPKLLSLMVDRARKPLFARLFLVPFVFKWILRTHLVHQKDVITDRVATLYREPWAATADGRKAFSRVIRASAEEMAVPLESLRQIKVPTLILWAQEDRILPPRFAHRLHADLPNSQLTILPNCGHFLQEETPEEIVAAIAAFMDRQ